MSQVSASPCLFKASGEGARPPQTHTAADACALLTCPLPRSPACGASGSCVSGKLWSERPGRGSSSRPAVQARAGPRAGRGHLEHDGDVAGALLWATLVTLVTEKDRLELWGAQGGVLGMEVWR